MELPCFRLYGQHLFSTVYADAESDLYLLCSDVMFTVSETELCNRSANLRTFLSVLRLSDPHAGTNALHVVQLANAEAVELTAFFDYIYASRAGADRAVLEELESQETFESLSHILRVSALFLCADARRYAVDRLNALPVITSAQRLRISRDFFIPQWFRAAAMDLIKTPLTEWTDEDVVNVGAESLLRIIRIVGAVHTHRRRLILTTPMVSPAPCANATCLVRWDSAWRVCAVPVLLGERYISAASVEARLLHDLLLHSGRFCPVCTSRHLDLVEQACRREELLIVGLVNNWFDSIGFFDARSKARAILRRSEIIERRRGADPIT